MIGHIIQREFFDHLNSLRFALTVIIMVALMVTNAVVHLQSHPDKVRAYSENITDSRDELQSQTELYELLKKGPGKLYKQPSALTFIADGGDAFLPRRGTTNWGSWSRSASFSGQVRSIWSLDYPTANPNARDLRPKATKIDWVFTITYLLSFIPLLFTFDALSGERESGTLRLCLANPISRPALLVGKFLGTLIAVLIPFYFRGPAESRGDFHRQLDASRGGRLGTFGNDHADCFRLCEYLHRSRVDGLRGYTRYPSESRRAVDYLGGTRRLHAFYPRHAFHKMDVPRPNGSPTGNGKKERA